MSAENSLIIGYNRNGSPLALNPAMANRHGLIAGATGTGKTVTLQSMAESLSAIGVPVFTVDVKGDLAGIAKPGGGNPKVEARLNQLNISNQRFEGSPVILWDLYAKRGHHVRSTISEMGPILLGRLLDLNPTQTDVLQVAFKIADDQGLLLLDIKDLRSVLSWMEENSAELKSDYGNISGSTLATIQRNLLTLSESGADGFFGEPALQLQHLMQSDFSGRGVVSVLDATTLLQDPRAYSTFLLWLLSELFEELNEVGDLPKPRLALFFDEAHLLFKETPKALLEKIELVVRLIRSKGVGVYFVTQNPLDIPESVLAQLGNRVQHALRAFTPADEKAVKAAARTFRQNPEIKTEEVLTQLEVGEALVSLLDSEGRPTPVERIFIAPPKSRLGPLEDSERQEIISRSPMNAIYSVSTDRESAYEILLKRRQEKQAQTEAKATTSSGGGFLGSIFGTGDSQNQKRAPGRPKDTLAEALAKSVARSIGSSLGRQIVRGVLGSIMR